MTSDNHYQQAVDYLALATDKPGGAGANDVATLLAALTHALLAIRQSAKVAAHS